MASRKYLTIGSGVGIGLLTIIGFFQTLAILYGFQISDFTGNIICEGTYENPCISEFTVRNPNAYNVDIYNKNQVKLEFSPEIEDYALFTYDGRCTAKGCSCVLDDGRKIGFENWRCTDFTNATKPLKDREYVFRFPSYSTKRFLLAGIKKTPYNDVKWSLGIDKGFLDPVWEGVEETEPVKKIINTRFTPTTKIEEYDDNTGNAIIHSAQRYTDSNGTLIENTYSLKDCEFAVPLKVIEDKNNPVEIVNYNLTSMRLKVKVTATEIGKNIPLVVFSGGNESDVKFQTTVKLLSVGTTTEFILPFGLDKTIKFGEHSTNVSIDSTGYGIDTYYINSTKALYGSQIKFDIRNVTRKNILHATLRLHTVEGSAFPTCDNDITLWGITDQTWTEASSAATINTQTKSVNVTTTFNNQSNVTSYIEVTNIVQDCSLKNYSNCTVRFEDADYLVGRINIVDVAQSFLMIGNQSADPFPSAYFEGSENVYGVPTPSLNITYTELWNTTTAVGVYNNTYSNSTGLYVNLTGGNNGTYTSQVFAANTSNDRNNINLTVDALVQDGFTVNGSVRIYNFSNLSSSLVFWTGFDDGNNDTGFSYYSNFGVGASLSMSSSSYWDIIGSNCLEGLCFHIPSASDETKITLTSNINISSWTIIGFVYLNGGEDLAHILNGVGINVAYTSGQLTQCQFAGSQNQDLGFFRNRTRTMIGCTSNGTHYAPIFEGGVKSTWVTTNNVTLNFSVFNIGNDIFSNDNLNGTLDNLMIFNRSLTSAEVLELNGSYPRWRPYSSPQSFPNGISNKNYSVTPNFNFYQYQLGLYGNSTDTPIVYYANTTLSNVTPSVEAEDTTPPTYSNVGVNNTAPAILEDVKFYSLWQDDVALGSYIFSWNATGLSCDTWANDSSVLFGAEEWANVTKTIPATCVLTENIGYRFYANDSSGNKNDTGVLLIGTGDTCTYSSGDWHVDCSDNCHLTSSINMGGSDLYLDGSGSFYLEANITDVDDIFKNVDCSIYRLADTFIIGRIG